MNTRRKAVLTQLKRSCRNAMGWWSGAGLVYTAAMLYLNEPTIPLVLVGLALLVTIAREWDFYRTLRSAHEYLTQYDSPTKEKP